MNRKSCACADEANKKKKVREGGPSWSRGSMCSETAIFWKRKEDNNSCEDLQLSGVGFLIQLLGTIRIYPSRQGAPQEKRNEYKRNNKEILKKAPVMS